jgi:hypothetical protein
VDHRLRLNYRACERIEERQARSSIEPGRHADEPSAAQYDHVGAVLGGGRLGLAEDYICRGIGPRSDLVAGQF